MFLAFPDCIIFRLTSGGLNAEGLVARRQRDGRSGSAEGLPPPGLPPLRPNDRSRHVFYIRLQFTLPTDQRTALGDGSRAQRWFYGNEASNVLTYEFLRPHSRSNLRSLPAAGETNPFSRGIAHQKSVLQSFSRYSLKTDLTFGIFVDEQTSQSSEQFRPDFVLAL